MTTRARSRCTRWSGPGEGRVVGQRHQSALLGGCAVADPPGCGLLLHRSGRLQRGRQSTVAAHLAKPTRATVLHMDDFYANLDPTYRIGLDPAKGCDEYFDWRRVRRVLTDLKEGKAIAYEKFDWTRGTGLVPAEVARPARLLLLEGVYSCRPELEDLLDLKVLVESPPGVRSDRRAQRPDLAPWPDLWDAAERHYFSHIRRPDDFDLVVAGW